MKAEFGEANVFDFSLGNPNACPPAAFFDALRSVAEHVEPSRHRYMPNAGFEETRRAVAEFLSREYGLEFDAASIVMTSGAAGGMNAVLRAICDPGDEVIVLSPYFPEYRFYIEQCAARMVVVQTDDRFQPDLAAIEKAITLRTRAILINSPNNPTGAVYGESACRELAAGLRKHDRTTTPLYLITDDPYRRIVFGSERCPTPVTGYPRSIVVSSYSKDLSIPGERAGYIALPPSLPERATLVSALTVLNRTLGFVNMSAFMQRVIAQCADACCDLGMYRKNCALLSTALRGMGYQLVQPGGALYLFPRTPIDDDLRFIDTLSRHRVLAVPGRGFGRPGHMRISFAVEPAVIERSLPAFRAAMEEVTQAQAQSPA